MIVFTHIAKTSGTSFAASIRSNFSNCFEFEEMEEYSNSVGKPITKVFESNQKIDMQPDFVHSHIPYGFHEIFRHSNPKYVVMLRDPIDRCLSSIRHSMKIRNIKGLVGDNILSRLVSNSKSNIKLIGSLKLNEINCNVMTKQISGLCYRNSIIADDMKLQAQYYMPYLHDKISYSNQEMEEMLDIAKSNLDNYSFVGFQDSFDDSVDRFCNLFGFKSDIPKVRYKSISHRFFDIDVNSNEVQDAILSINEYDMQLYNYAKAKYK